ncbi:MAG: DNA mismatch repair endonuclease MutL [Candidatus Liberibacter europaeus]|uniref:DNA mismatch repair protein MutL n=1 Tax=Candidatus Liberibacter europaeus TaxID=744859 RepID=A0A2T4VXQ1_9HYPH|nr:DNA mismatch repair endonuclease MutL [Candidatus Liberibacter europaeus]PTL86556.1 MAG: DNA mismatch repair endonuclease MutL [Candidatus Liberibacter europaeus]
MKIRKLSEKIVNQIAAGEVIERPYIAIKELIENSIDAESTCIETVISEGGKSLFQISDNGYGMTSEEIKMAVQRHCTSKIFDDFSNIRTFGFRGEALPSIGSVSHLTVMSRDSTSTMGAKIIVSGDKISSVNPVAINPGTIVEVRDLFFTIPARLNFLKSTQVETNLITDLIKRMAIAHPAIRFTLATNKNGRYNIDFQSTFGNLPKRISQVIGKDFIKNAIELNEISQGITLRGYAGIPTFNKGKANQIYVFVNGRIIQDKFLFASIRSAYAETIPQKRYPVIVLLIEIDPKQVDVNVHPAKSDVRFRNPSIVRSCIIKSIQKSINQKGISTSSILSNEMIASFNKPNTRKLHLSKNYPQTIPTEEKEFSFKETTPPISNYLDIDKNNFTNDYVAETKISDQYHLGMACAQIYQNYIISQTSDELIIVDQHAAHERIVFEKMRKDFNNKKITSQILLIPEIIDLLEIECSLVIEHKEDLHRLGIAVERFGPNAIAIREIPAIIPKRDVSILLKDIVDEIIENNTISSLTDKIEKILATMACYASIRSGRKMQTEEMNALLREMEKNPNSAQCNHGRPTFIKLKLSDIEKLFGR